MYMCEAYKWSVRLTLSWNKYYDSDNSLLKGALMIGSYFLLHDEGN